MKYRKSELLAAESIATAATKTIDINTQDPISRISVIVKLTNANDDPAGHPAEALKKIEVVDGSNVLFSLTGSRAAGMAYFGTKRQPWQMLDYVNTEYCMFCADLYFGRELWDPDLALVPAHFKNLQMRIEHDKALGGNTPVAGTMQVWMDLFDEKVVNPFGFLQSKEHYRFTQVASTTYYTDLPTDYPIRLIMFGAHNTTEGPEYNVDNIKITEEHDKHVILEAGLEELNLMESGLTPPWIDTFYGKVKTDAARSFYVAPTWERRSALVQNNDLNGTFVITNSAGQVLSILGEQASSFEGLVAGKYPFGQQCVYFGRPEVHEDWWEANMVDNARMRLECAAGPDVSETMVVALQQLRTY